MISNKDHSHPLAPCIEALDRGEALLVPYICDISCSEPVPWEGDRNAFVESLQEKIEAKLVSRRWA